VSQCGQGASNDSAFTSFEKHPYVTDTLPSNALDVKSSEEMTLKFMVYIIAR